MIDALEIRLADLLADALVGTDNLGPVGRIDGVDAPAAGTVGIAVRIGSLAPRIQVADDHPEEIRADNQIRLRPTLHLKGEADVRLIASPPNGAQSAQARARLLGVQDRVLLALHPGAVRTGRAFDTGIDQGFELDGFRLESAGTDAQDTLNPLQVVLRYSFAGRFWPVEEAPAGDVITSVPRRLTVMPLRLPERLVAQAGGANLSVPLRLDMSVADGAASAIAARLEGAASPGALIGDGTTAPGGFTGFSVGPDGVSDIIYQPPANLGAPALVRVETRLAHPDRPSIPLARFAIEVLAS